MTIYDMAISILDVCDYIVHNSRMDESGHLIIEIAPVLNQLRAIVKNRHNEEDDQK